MIYHIDSKNKRLIFPASFTAIFELVFVLKRENPFPLTFVFKFNKKEHKFLHGTIIRAEITCTKTSLKSLLNLISL